MTQYAMWALPTIEYLKFHSIGRFGTPCDIGKLVSFLAGGDASFIVGSGLVTDGGMTTFLFKT
jgi:NAD(P)-dependent dehydrogenase (short-subunit alcohol dehydrogenase family)